MFLATDARFWSAARVTAVFAVASVALELLLGPRRGARAVDPARGRRLAPRLLLLAWALPAVVTAKVFEWLYHPAAGLVNFVLGGRQLNWLGDPALALPALILADVWRTMPFVALLCYARLLGIPGRALRGGRGRRRRARGDVPADHAAAARGAPVIAVLFRTLDALRASTSCSC